MRRWKLRVFAQTLAAGIIIAPQLPAQYGNISPGLVDTMEVIVGKRPTLIRDFDCRVLGGRARAPCPYFAALFEPVGDTIFIRPIAAIRPRHTPSATVDDNINSSPDWVYAHEIGHRFDFYHNLSAHPGWQQLFWSTAAEAYYDANANSKERFAAAFANAVDYLRWASVPRPFDDLVAAYISREKFIPGTGLVVNLLLTLPIYHEHRLNDEYIEVSP